MLLRRVTIALLLGVVLFLQLRDWRNSPLAAAFRDPPMLRLELVTNQLQEPVGVTHAGDGSGRLFVIERRGRIVVLQDSVSQPSVFLDITPLVGSSGSEQGLLGLAFHPAFASNGLFYVNYTDRSGDTVIARYSISPEHPDVADPSSQAVLLWVAQPAANHNGGHLVFGPDGYLYIGTGDGGQSGDPWDNAQNLGVLLGKMLRIDVDGGQPYAIPPDNPFLDEPFARPEVWAYGLRNPWRYSFDRANGDLYIADVGQNAWEWVHLQQAGVGGQNYGWDVVEGSHCFEPAQGCRAEAFPRPVAEYDRALGCSIIGGHVYRGARFPQFEGRYFFGDFCSGRIWSLHEQAGLGWQQREVLQAPVRISSFGEDETGELYLTSLNDGGLYHLVPP